MATDYLSGALPSDDDDETQTVPHAEDVAPLLQQRIPGLVVTGMARTPAQNAAVNGAPNSAHLTDRALDIRATPGLTLDQLQQHVTALGLPNAKVIYEGPGAANSTAPHFHIQWGTPDSTIAAPQLSTPDYLSGHLPADTALPPAKHAGWRANGTNVEWYDPNNPNAKAPPTPPQTVASTTVDAARTIPGGLAQGVAGIVGLPGTIQQGVRAAGDYLLNKISPGSASIPLPNDTLPSSADVNALLSAPTGGYYQPKTTVGEYTQTGASFVPALFGGEGSLLGRAFSRVLAPAAASEAAGEATQGTPYEPLARIGGALVGGGAAALTRAAPRGAAALIAPYTEGGREDLATQGALNVIHHFAGGPVETPNIQSGVPGVERTLAEAGGPATEAGVGALTRTVHGVNPNTPFYYRQTANNTARADYFQALGGTPEDVEEAADARNAAGANARKQLFDPANAKPVDLGPVKAVANAIMEGPDRGSPAVKAAMNDVKSIVKTIGSDPDPETAYRSLRMGINNLISGKDLTKQYGVAAAAHLIQVRDALDDAMEAATPGFKQYLSDFEEASGPINAMKFLQDQKLANADGTITLGAVQRALDRLAKQQAAPGIKLGKSVSDTQREGLEAIRDDLLRQSKIKAGQNIGSPTVEKALNQQRLGLAAHITPVLPTTLGAIAGETIGSHLGFPGIGETVGGGIGAAIGGGFNQNALIRAATQAKLEHFLLNPSDYAVARDAAALNASPGATQLLQRGVRGYIAPAAAIAPNRNPRRPTRNP